MQSSPVSSFPAARFAHPHSEIIFAVSNELCCVHFLFQHYVHSLSHTPTSLSFFQPCPIFFVMLIQVQRVSSFGFILFHINPSSVHSLAFTSRNMHRFDFISPLVQPLKLHTSMGSFLRFFCVSLHAALDVASRRVEKCGGHRMASHGGFLPSRVTALTWTRHQCSRVTQCITAQQAFATRRFAEAAFHRSRSPYTARPPFFGSSDSQNNAGPASWQRCAGPCTYEAALVDHSRLSMRCYNILAVAVV